MKGREENVSNQRIHLVALSMTKLGDGLVDPKLVLAWLVSFLGASAGWVGLLVPIREAGALLPQLFTAERLRRFAVRKWWWVWGSAVQGIAVLGIAAASLWLQGEMAGLVIVSLVAVFALARSVCSVSYKDVLGKTVEKGVRGTVTGTAAAVAAPGVLIFGLLLLMGVVEQINLVSSILCIAAGLWLLAAWWFSFLDEPPTETKKVITSSVFYRYINYLRYDRELVTFIIVRALLTATAVAPPFLILLAQVSETGLVAQLGALVVAASLSTLVSGRIWGKLSDISTPKVLVFAGLLAAVTLGVSVAATATSLYNSVWFLPLLLFVLMFSYQGVRISRSVHLVNIATEDTRAAYTAIANTIIGVVLLATGGLGFLAENIGIAGVVVLLSGMSLLGGLLALRLRCP